MFLHKSEFGAVSADIVARIKQRNRSQRAIFILDQYAYKDVPLKLVNHILSTVANSEVIMTFNYDSLQRYISERPENKKAIENINIDQYIDWSRLAQFKEANFWEAAIQEQLSNAIWQASGAKHMTLFFISPKKKSPYWLVHLSKVYRARDVMMALHYKHSNEATSFSHHLSDGVFSLGYRAIETPGQSSFDLSQTFDFGEQAQERCIVQLSTEIPKILCDCTGPISFAELTDSIGSLTPASETQIKSAIQEAMDNKEIVVHKKGGGQRVKSSQIRPVDVIEYQQYQLFP